MFTYRIRIILTYLFFFRKKIIFSFFKFWIIAITPAIYHIYIHCVEIQYTHPFYDLLM